MQAAVAKEGLRMFPGTIAHPRVVPRDGAVIAGEFIPGGVRINFPSTQYWISSLMFPLPL